TPLVRAKRLGVALGVKQLYVKNDAVNFPTLSFKDRVVSVALSKARELGFSTVGCASTGNLANSVAANAASAGLDTYILVPSDLEKAK
ncbi:MAG TPA: pyridoxal-phosphate dependent enzyme, partial [Gemmatales bacterium]|nr:pyridoxal-phosphate dependent enzyme [Gemmatales bacterium]